MQDRPHFGPSYDLTGYYGSRWGIESSLRDSKDLRFGMGMGSVHVSTPERRDRLWLINGLAVVLLTLLGAASQAIGYQRFSMRLSRVRCRFVR